MNYKICTKCGKEFEATVEFFYKRKRGKFGLCFWCKNCMKGYNKKYQIEHREHLKKYLKKWCANNVEYSKEYKKKYYIENIGHIREYRKDNADRNKKRRTENKEWKRQYDKKYRKDNRDERNALAAKREAKKRNQTPDLTEKENQQIINIYKKRRGLGPDWHVDHILPLSKGGLHHPDNLQIVVKKFNLEKGAKTNFRLPFVNEIFIGEL